MTRNQIVIEDIVELINEHGGIESFSQAMSQLMDRAMAIERADVLGAEPYQRTDTRCGYANGFKPKTLHTRLGPVPLKVPQVRGDVSFYPSALTKGPQTERALTLAVAEMYIQGVSRRKVEPILEKLVGHGISSSICSKTPRPMCRKKRWPTRSQKIFVMCLTLRIDTELVNDLKKPSPSMPNRLQC